ncbi:MAG TPA: hypothetical protein DCL63_11705 [Firmicutes bacterium]|nr:hypothetical protein [Bacillota bacterium]
MPEYACQIVSVGAPALMTNYIGDSDIEECPSFGGAFAVSADGEAVASLPLGVEGALLVDLDKLL